MPDLGTPQGPSLESASTAIAGLLSQREDTPVRETQPEQVRSPKGDESTPKEPPTQAPAAAETTETAPPEGSESDTVEATGEEPEQPTQPRLVPVKVDGEERMVTEDELIKSYSFNAHNTRTAQRLADQKREFEEKEVAAVRQERSQYAKYLAEMRTMLDQAKPKEPDWQKLRMDATPDVFAQEWASWDAHTKSIEKIESEQAMVAAQEATDAHAGFQRYVTEQRTKLEDALPEFKDPEKAKVLTRDLNDFGKGLGFSDEDLGQVTDHRLVLMLHKAMQYDRAQQKAPAVQNKIKQALETTPPGSRTTTTPKSKLVEAKERLRKSGSVDDGAAAIAHLL